MKEFFSIVPHKIPNSTFEDRDKIPISLFIVSRSQITSRRTSLVFFSFLFRPKGCRREPGAAWNRPNKFNLIQFCACIVGVLSTSVFLRAEPSEWKRIITNRGVWLAWKRILNATWLFFISFLWANKRMVYEIEYKMCYAILIFYRPFRRFFNKFRLIKNAIQFFSNSNFVNSANDRRVKIFITRKEKSFPALLAKKVTIALYKSDISAT